MDFPNRKRLRKLSADYSHKGAYFITICTADNQCILGNIIIDMMACGDIGNIAEYWWHKIPERFPGVTLGNFVVMPNHVHGIIILEGNWRIQDRASEREATEGLPYESMPDLIKRGGTKAAPSVPQIMHWYKTWTTNEYFRYMKGKYPVPGNQKLWHRSYYDHIIRSDEDFQRISDYIENNPANWSLDRFAWPSNL